jgi:CTP synthase
MRLGLYPCRLVPGTRAADAYAATVEPDQEGDLVVRERHRHRFEVNNAFRGLLEDAGMVFSGLSPDGRLIEIGELSGHPFMLGSQFHPELRSRPTRPHPLFEAFIRSAAEYRDGRRAGEQASAGTGADARRPDEPRVRDELGTRAG